MCRWGVDFGCQVVAECKYHRLVDSQGEWNTQFIAVALNLVVEQGSSFSSPAIENVRRLCSLHSGVP